MKFMLMPFDQHSDRGLGAMGKAFELAAESLEANVEQNRTNQDRHLPIAFLRRHAIELYLKSMIVVIHRSLRVDFGSHPYDDTPYILSKQKWVRIDSVHSIGALWDYVSELIRSQHAVLQTRCKTDWTATPGGLEEAIRSINDVDPASTYCRYPDIKGDKPLVDQRPGWKARTVEDLQADLHGATPVQVFLTVGAGGEVVRATQRDSAPMAEYLIQLRETASALFGAHLGLRCELADGT